jgi:hypothetical protein
MMSPTTQHGPGSAGVVDHDHAGDDSAPARARDGVVRPGYGTASTVARAGSTRLYELVLDVADMGRWSPECVGADRPDGVAIEPGVAFTGHNERGDNRWSTTCTVRAAVPGHLFQFEAGEAGEATIWTYTFRDLGDGRTELTESFEAPLLARGELDGGSAEAGQLSDRLAQLRQDLATTLAGLRAFAEQEVRP